MEVRGILELTNEGGTNYVTERRCIAVAQARRIKVKGVRRDEIDTEQLALIYWLQAKRVLRERREREAKAKAKRREKRS
jgi:hypothetical protein